MATDLTRRFLDTFKPEKDQAITDGKTERLKARFHICKDNSISIKFEYHYTFNGKKQNPICIGKYNRKADNTEKDRTLADARNLANLYNSELNKGLDPKALIIAKIKEPTLEDCFNEILNSSNFEKSTIISYKYGFRKLEKYKNFKISQINNKDLLREICKNSTNAQRTVLRQVLSLAENNNYIDRAYTLPKPIKSAVKHYSIYCYSDQEITKEDYKKFVFTPIQQISSTERLIIFELTALTCLRFNEVVSLTWGNIDFKNKVIRTETKTIKAKNGNELFVVPMTTQMEKIFKYWFLNKYDRSTDISYVRNERLFTCQTHPLSNYICKLLQKYKTNEGKHQTIHGLRTLSQKIMNQLDIEISVADFCLSHKPNSTQSAYTRDFALSKRKDAMQKYNDWIEDAIGEYSVIKKCIQM